MPFSDVYRRQVELLVQSIPPVAEEECFALKGGTAINLFVRDVPRLSVDIDLTYLPNADRKQSLADIDAALRRIGDRIKQLQPTYTITKSAPSTQDTINKLVIRTPNLVQIKVEVTPVLRGCVYRPRPMAIVERAEEEFGFAEINVLSFADLYAGKIMAALDRQHPRDLFDVHQLLINEGLGDDLRTALVVYLISLDHAPDKLLAPAEKDISHEYRTGFLGMTETDVSLNTLLSARRTLVEDIRAGLTDEHKAFLLSFYRREPEWGLLAVAGVDQLPAVKWRELNLDRAGEDTQAAIARNLEEVLSR
jgi:predicted nucleotidyltransferase component of viral defense system